MTNTTPTTQAITVINSLADVQKLHKQEHYARIQHNREKLQSTVEFVRNLGGSELIRTELLRFLLDGPRDIDAECGYPAWLTPDHYKAMYDREGVAKRIVDCEPEESWAMDPEIFEVDEEDKDTKFEKAWTAVNEEHNLIHYMTRVDVLSGIGQFGILLFGIDDAQDLMNPVDGLNEDGTFSEDMEHKLLYIRAFDETVVFVKTRETDPNNPRYGKPKIYTIQFRDFPNWGIQAGEIIARDVHWSRCIHVADNRKMSEVYGVPRMQPVWNRLYDLRKVYSSSGEGYWKGAFPGISFEVNPDLADQGIEIDKEQMRKEFEAYQNGLQRYLATTGVTAKSLQPQVTDPTPTLESHLKAIAIAKAIPYRVLFGSEEAKLAADQDSRAWNKRVKRRQDKYLSPMLVRPVVDRLIDLGVLPKPKQYFVKWPDLNTPTDADKAQVALVKTQAIQTYVNGGCSQLMPPDQWLTMVLGLTSEQKDAVLDGAGQFNSDQEDGGEEDGDSEQTDASGLGDPVNSPSTEANALNTPELAGQGTIGKGGKGNKAKRVDAELVRMPELNSRGQKIVVNRSRHFTTKLVKTKARK